MHANERDARIEREGYERGMRDAKAYHELQIRQWREAYYALKRRLEDAMTLADSETPK